MCGKGVFETPQLAEKGGVQMRRGGLWVCSSAWCEKGIMRRFSKKNALWVGEEIKERAVCTSLNSQTPGGSVSNNFSEFVNTSIHILVKN